MTVCSHSDDSKCHICTPFLYGVITVRVYHFEKFESVLELLLVSRHRGLNQGVLVPSTPIEAFLINFVYHLG